MKTMLSSVQIGQKITDARKQNRLSQAELANKIAISPQAVGKWERGESLPDIITLSRIAALLKVDLNYFDEEGTFPSEQKLQVTEVEQITKDPRKTKWNLSSGNWNGADFSGIDKLQEKFNSSNIKNCKFIDAQLQGISFSSNNIVGCDFSGANLSKSLLKSSNIASCNFENAHFLDAEFSRSHIKKCNFNKSLISGLKINGSGLEGCTLENVNFENLSISSCYLSTLEFNGRLTSCEFENSTFRKVVFKNCELRTCFFRDCDMRKVEFIDCKADKLTTEFLRICGVDVSKFGLISN